jgi:RHS repeat-associated protein
VSKKTTTSEVITVDGLYERRNDGNGTTHVFYLPGDGQILGQILCTGNGACGQPTFFHPDRLGTIDTVTGNGMVVGREKRDPFGRAYSLTSMSGSDETVTLGFTGQTEDTEVGLINMNHRLYDPRLGRFISPDPLVKSLSGQDFNRYAYAGNNPLSFIDRTGLQAVPPPDPGDAPPDLSVDPGDVSLLVGQPTWTFDGSTVTLNYMTRDPTSGPSLGDFGSFQPINGPPALPTPSSPPSPSQSFINQGRPGVEGGGNNPFPGDGSNTYAQFFYPPPWLSGGDEKQQRTMIDAQFAVTASAIPLAVFGAVAPAVVPALVPLGPAVGRVFWSGGLKYAGTAAAEWAAANGGVTLEMTLTGRILTAATGVFGYRLVAPLWDLASGRFAGTAVGDIEFFMSLSRGVSATSTFLRLELPAMLQTNAVQNVGLHLLP